MKEVSLQNIADGVAAELWNREMRLVAANINDQNTAALKKRTIVLKFTFAPTESREEVDVAVEAKSSLASVRPFKKTVYTGKQGGVLSLFNADQRQGELFQTQAGNVQSIKAADEVMHA